MKGPTQRLANFIVETKFDDLPDEVVYQTKRVILDTIGCAVGGYSTDMGKIIIEYARDLGGKPESTLIVTGDKTSCLNAAFVNSQLANVLDADETFLGISHHANAVVFSALAVGERVKTTGKDFITSVTLGFDIAARIGLSMPVYRVVEPERKIEVLSEYGHSWIVFGAAAATGKLLGLNGKGMAEAFGIAGYSAPVPTETKFFIAHPKPMTKYSFVGAIAQAGVMGALLAQKGFRGDSTVLDGNHGFWKMMGAMTCDWDIITRQLGEKWWIMETSFKPYACCRWMHLSLDLFYKIFREQRLSPQEIESVTVKVHPVAIAEKLGEAPEPQDEVDAQFSIQNAIAAAALDIKSGPDWYAPDKLKDPRPKEFIKKVVVDIEPRAYEIMREQLLKGVGFRRTAATVEVTARGKVFSAYAEYAKGDPEIRMSDSELREKFRNFSYKTLRIPHIEKAIETIYELEKLDKISRLTKLLTL